MGSEYNVTGTRADAAQRSNLRADAWTGQIRQSGAGAVGITLRCCRSGLAAPIAVVAQSRQRATREGRSSRD